MGNFFTVKVQGGETLLKDLQNEIKGIEDASHSALNYVESAFREDLQTFIAEEWYKKWGPPKKYERRTDKNNYGTPLEDMEKNADDSTINGLTLSFVYSPTGEHKISMWDTHDGDEIIKIIQDNSGWTYRPTKDKQGREIMPRPFWNKFVEYEFNGGAFAAFDYGFGGRGYNLISEGISKDIKYDSGESFL